MSLEVIFAPRALWRLEAMFDDIAERGENASKLFLLFAKDSLGLAKFFLGICKLFFGGFVEFQRVAREKRKKKDRQIILGPARPETGFGAGNSERDARAGQGSSTWFEA